MGEKAAIVTSDPCQRKEEAVYSHTALIVNFMKTIKGGL